MFKFHITTITSPPKAIFAIIIMCLTSLLIAYFYMESYLGLPPCPLCILARYAIGTIALFSLLMLWCYPKYFMPLWLSALLALITGIIVAVRHVWLTYNPYEMCTFDPEAFSIINFITKAFRGTEDCGLVDWTFLGLNIPEQTLILYLLLIVLMISVKRKHTQNNSHMFL